MSERAATIDFLIAPTEEQEPGGSIKGFEADFAAVVAPGLHLAFRDRQRIHLTGRTIENETSRRHVQVSGAGAYVALKALAFDGRGENKDAYDLFYVLRNFGAGPRAVATAFEPLLEDASAAKALEILRRDFTRPDQVGPRRVCAFLDRVGDEDLAAEVAAFARAFLAALASPR